MGEGNGIGTVIRGFVVLFMEKQQNFCLMILPREWTEWSELCFELMRPLKTWHILGITKSFLFIPLRLETPCSLLSWVWSLFVLGLPSGRTMDPLFSLLMQSPTLSPPYTGNHFSSDMGGSPGMILKGRKSWFLKPLLRFWKSLGRLAGSQTLLILSEHLGPVSAHHCLQGGASWLGLGLSPLSPPAALLLAGVVGWD